MHPITQEPAPSGPPAARPPAVVTVAGILAIAGVVLGLLPLLSAARYFWLGDIPARVVGPALENLPPAAASVFLQLVVYGLPGLQLAGAVQLLTGRGRGLLVASGLLAVPPTLWAVDRVIERPEDFGWPLAAAVAALPALAALLGLLPQAGRWTASPTRSGMPAAAAVAAVLALMSSGLVLLLRLSELTARGFGLAGGEGAEPMGLAVVRAVVLAALVVGALLLLLGRSWLVLAAAAAAEGALTAFAGLAQGGHGLGAALLPLALAVLASLPTVRRWVTEARSPS
ncbi:hypothetical protein [Blastococcus sp. LR1]|uniref:hypothetical protein n=1 Tax=Blastococcus sp. LR1 TaxID=2877000 RepID=UPI001CCE43B0|nr:hypothetical protein [Blastococcus sp. LR1]MCA0143527.1 hypothetical protein [Blastococcus sp. LR1]